jgi:tetratricopeptide (TPR) repeat protein
MSPATSRGALISVAAALVLLFSFTSVLSSAYHATRHSRAEVLYHAGLALAAAGRDAEAADQFRAALTYEHNDPEYRMALAKSLIALGRLKEAETHLNELREDDPTSGPINLMLARVAAGDKRQDEAVIHYHRAIYGFWREKPEENRIAARFELVDYLIKTGQEKQLLAELLNLVDDLSPNDLTGRMKAARLLLEHGSPQHAAGQFRAVLAAQPNNAAGSEGLGDALFAMGDFVGARNAYRAAERHRSQDPALQHRLQLAESALSLDPTLVHLSSAQRFARAQELVRRTLDVAQPCHAADDALTSEAQAAIAEKPSRRQDGDALKYLNMADRLWRARQQACGNQPPTDEALAAVMSKVEKQ